jgi:hypothetical protein
MIIKLFRENQIFSVFVTAALSISLWMISGFYAPVGTGIEVTSNSALLFLLPAVRQINNFRIISASLNIIILLFSSLYFARIIVRYQIIPQRTSLPSFLLLLISAPYFQFYNGLSFPLISFFILLIILDILFSVIDSKATSMRFFDISLILSVASFFNFYFLFFMVFLIFVWVQFRGIQRWRELVYIFLGVIIPYAFYFAALYLANIKISGFLNADLIFQNNRLYLPISKPLYMLGSVFGILILIASLHIIQKYVKMKIITRKYSLIFLSLFFVIFLITILYPGIKSDIVFFLSLPVGFLLSYYFSTCRLTIFNQILLILLIAGNILIFVFK